MNSNLAREIATRVIDWIDTDNRDGGHLGRTVIMQRCLNQAGVTNADWASDWRQVTILVDQLRQNVAIETEADTPEVWFVDDGEPIDYIPVPWKRAIDVEVVGASSRVCLHYRKAKDGSVTLVDNQGVMVPSHVLDTARSVAQTHLALV